MSRSQKLTASERRQALYDLQRDCNARELGATVLSDDEAGALYALRSACLAARAHNSLDEQVARALDGVELAFGNPATRRLH